MKEAITKSVNCHNCPNNFECNLMAYPLATRKWACLYLSMPEEYFNHFSNTQPQLIIPENPNNWESRLLELQYYGDWVRDDERVGEIGSLADLSKYETCNSSQLLNNVTEQYNEENNN